MFRLDIVDFVRYDPAPQVELIMSQTESPLVGLSRTEKRQLLKDRTKKFALEIIHLCADLPRTPPMKIIAGQLLRSSTSVAANYRACCRARSVKEFVAKVGVVVEECDESQFWLELLEAQAPSASLAALVQESDELVAIFVASRRTAAKALKKGERTSIGNRQSAIGNES
jgi:four helix bundle protein